ncbi:NAAT family transporter [bacterium]|nr:NAAT family transporter [bacterium]
MSLAENFFLVFFPAIFAIVNPIGVIGPFVALTGHQSDICRKRVAMNACWTSLAILVSCVFVGTLVFKIFGISIGAVRIGGGLLLLFVGLEMVRQKAKMSSEAEDPEEISVFPLAVPLLAGPGSIVTVLVLVEKYPETLNHILLALALTLNFLCAYLILRHSSKLMSLIGPTAMRVFSKLMGILVTCLAIQFVTDGVIESIQVIKAL